MKKIVLSALCAGMFIATANAQPFKQAGGEKNLQVLFAPLGGQPISMNGISFRKFNASGTGAWRLNLFLGMKNTTEISVQAADTGMDASTSMYPLTTSQPMGFNGAELIINHGVNPEAQKKTKSFTFSLRPGYEKHFAGTDRLSPYVGAELLFSKTTSKTTEEVIDKSNVTYVITDTSGFAGVDKTVQSPYTIYSLESKNHKDDGAETTFGINLIAGVDFYIVKNLSLGAELGFGWSSTSYPDYESQYVLSKTTDVRTEQDPPEVSFNTITTTYTVTNKAAEKQGKKSQLGPNVVGQFKLGWLF